jgi:mRNA degradation ribonuclease J1/J2
VKSKQIGDGAAKAGGTGKAQRSRKQSGGGGQTTAGSSRSSGGAAAAPTKRAARKKEPARSTQRTQPAAGAGAVRVVFLGGLGEIGRNCACIEVDGRILVLDVGIMFPDPDMPGVDLVLPDFTYLRENADRVDGVILTHGHEDHTGGLAYLLRDFPVSVYGSELTLALARNRVDEAGMASQAQFIPVRDGERRRIGPCDVEFIPVSGCC